MGLHANGFRDTGTCFQTFGATASNNAYPGANWSNFHRPGARRNITAGEGIVTDNVAYPSGNLHPNAWMLPQKSGALASRNFIQGDGDSSASITAGKNGECSIVGTGELTGIGALIVSLLSAITASGTISSAAVDAFLQLASELEGTGDAEAILLAIGHAATALSGSGTAATTSTATAKGTLAADITVTGATLSTANVGDAVWGAFAEAGYTYQDILRLIAAVQLGKVSGGPGSPVFRDINDTTDRVTGTADSSGNRTAATYNPD